MKSVSERIVDNRKMIAIINQRCEDLKITNREFFRRAKLNPALMRHWKDNPYMFPRVENLIRMANTLDITISELIGETPMNIKTSNRKIGNDFEHDLCELLSKHGFWAHNFGSKAAGQPVDIIACKDNKTCLIDAKVCLQNNFRLMRLEENQKYSIKKFSDAGNVHSYFALKLKDGTIYMVDAEVLIGMREVKSMLNKSDIISLGMKFEDWVQTWE